VRVLRDGAGAAGGTEGGLMRLGRVSVVMVAGAAVLLGADAVSAQPPQLKPSVREDLAAAKRQLDTASQCSDSAEVAQQTLSIRAELERTTADLEHLQSVKASKTDPRYRNINVKLADLRRRLIALQEETKKSEMSGQQKAINKGTTDGAESKCRAEQAAERRRAGLDSIQKLLDIIRGMNPQI
jgi:hypothetical protein